MTILRNLTRLGQIWTGSIRGRLIIGISVLIAVVMSLFVATTVYRQDRFLSDDNQESAQTLAQTLAANSVSWVLASDLAGLGEVLQALKDYPDLRYAMVLTPDGKVLAHTDKALVGRFADDAVSRSLLEGAPMARTLLNNSSLVDSAAPIKVDGSYIGWARVSLDQKRLHDNLQDIARSGIVYAAFAVLAGILFAALFTRGLTGGLGRLLEVTRRFGAGDLSIRTGFTWNDELGAVGRAFDEMIGQIDRAGRELRASEASLKEAQRIAHVGNWTLDLETNALTWTEEVYRIFEVDPGQFMASYESFLTAVHPEDRSSIDKAYTESVRNMIPYDIEHRLLMKDGRVKFVHERCETVYDAQGKPLRSIGTVQDITTRKLAENASQEREAYISRLIEKSPLAMLVSSGLDQRVSLLNAKFMELFGYTLEDIPDVAHWWPLAYPDEAYREEIQTRWTDRATRAIETQGEIEPMEATVRCKDGSRRCIEFRMSSIGTTNLVTFVDLTERKLAEAKLRASGLYTRSLIEASLDPLVTISPEGKITDINRSTEKVTGVARTDLIGTDFANYFTEPEQAHAGYRQVLAQGYVRDYPLTIRHSDGHTIDVLYNATVYHDEAGELLGVFAAARDITERKRAEEAVRASEERLQLQVQRMPIGLIVWSPEFRVQTWNPAAERIFGFSADEAMGKHPYDFIVPKEAQPQVDDIWARLLKGDTTARSINANQTKDGRTIICDWHNTPLRKPDGTVAGALAMVQDITERIKAEEALREREEFLSSIVENIPNMVFIKDAKELRFVRFNKAGEDLLGYKREDLIGKNDYDFFPREQALLFTQKDREVLEGGQLYDIPEETINTKTDIRILHTKKVPILDANGKPTYLLGISSDITERKRTEFALARAVRALRTLSACNVALVRARDESEIVSSICRLIVETGGYRMAWVGYAEHDPARTVRPVAQYGFEEGYLATAKISWADNEFGRGPTGAAIRTGIIQVNQNFLINPALAPWREAAQQRGYQSSIALPLKGTSDTFGVLTIYAQETDAFREEEVKLLQELAEDLAFGIETLRTRADRDRIAFEQQHHEEILRHSLEDSIKAIAATVEMRDPYTAGHQRRVGQLAVAIARELKVPENSIHGIELAASIHDLGKINVPAEILSKPSRLTDIELMLVKHHAQAGYDILKEIKFPWPIATMVWQHHERLDGSGYPQGLKGEEIPLESRIMAVADVVEAMASHRPYRASLGIEAALQEVERGRGTVYDEAVVDACVRLFGEKRFAFAT